MHMVNDKGEAIYYNLVRKNNKDYWLVQGIGSTVVYGRDRERRKSRHFTHAQAAEHLHEELGDVRLCIKVLDAALGGDNTTAVEAEKLRRWLDRLTPEQRKTD